MAYPPYLALFGNTLDYAGTFPPAKLPLDEALAVAARFRRKGAHPWLLAKVALPLADIKSLTVDRLVAAGSNGEPWLFTALAAPLEPNDAEPEDERFLAAIEFDVREINRWNERFFDAPVRAAIVGYETRVPDAAFAGGTDGAFEFLAPALDRLSDRVAGRIDPWFEIPLSGAFRERVDAAAEALTQWKEDDSDGRVRPGLKFRTGGEQLPAPDALAFALVRTASAGLRFKATQGLHRRLSHGGQYGFVNVFATLAFASALGSAFDENAAKRCLLDESPDAFRWQPDGLRWGAFSLSVADIEKARQFHGGCFGSCSLDEPDTELKEV
jgi:hypothetical protein